VLDNYEVSASEEFWSKFPFVPLPAKPVTKVNANALQDILNENKTKLSKSQNLRAEKAIKHLREGAPSLQKNNLPPCFQKNAKISYKYGRFVTDSIMHWLQSGYVCGPFKEPPVSKLRVNSIVAIPQENKVRIVVNVSLPEGKSFNDNLDYPNLEKVKMSSARQVGHMIRKCGRGAKISKKDICDAYKQIPAPPEEFRLQAIYWLGRYFIEIDQMFGAASSVCNFDVNGNTMSTLSVAVSEVHPQHVFRHLDDSPVVGPASSGICEKFTETYEKLCARVNLKLADDCAKNEKAFSNQTNGKILGIIFDTKNLTWELPQDKKETILRKIHDAMNKEFISTTEMQKLAGHLNNVALMSPLLGGFKGNLNVDLAKSVSNGYEIVRLSVQSKKDLNVWANMILSKTPMPIPGESCAPPLDHLVFHSDAAGWADQCKGQHRPGVASVGISADGEIFFAFRLFWNNQMIKHLVDADNKRFGNKSSMLEFVGIMIPFLMIPESLKKQHIVLFTDNSGCESAWKNRNCKEDEYLSILVRCLHLISIRLSCVIHVRHKPRCSSWESVTVDNMSRDNTTSNSELRLLESFRNLYMPQFMSRWLSNPTKDWGLPMMCVEYVSDRIKS